VADDSTDNESKTEDATPERREEFRERGQVLNSKELTAVASLAAFTIFFNFVVQTGYQSISKFLIRSLQNIAKLTITPENFLNYLSSTWIYLLTLLIPIFAVTLFSSTITTLLQTRFNWSWERITPSLDKMNALSNLAKLFSMDSIVELVKSIFKIGVIGAVGYLILRGQWIQVPKLINMPIVSAWSYWLDISTQLFWGVAGLLIFLAAADYLYNFFTLEKQMRMSKDEIKQEYKNREGDPHVKARMKRIQRDIMSKKTIEKTKSATVIITNPTHYAVALRYELGMGAPIVVAKGLDFLALQMRELAKEMDIPIIEDKPLARTLYKLVEPGQEIPDSLYRAISEIIKYVFRIKGIKIPGANQRQQAVMHDVANENLS